LFLRCCSWCTKFCRRRQLETHHLLRGRDLQEESIPDQLKDIDQKAKDAAKATGDAEKVADKALKQYLRADTPEESEEKYWEYKLALEAEKSAQEFYIEALRQAEQLRGEYLALTKDIAKKAQDDVDACEAKCKEVEQDSKKAESSVKDAAKELARAESETAAEVLRQKNKAAMDAEQVAKKAKEEEEALLEDTAVNTVGLSEEEIQEQDELRAKLEARNAFSAREQEKAAQAQAQAQENYDTLSKKYDDLTVDDREYRRAVRSFERRVARTIKIKLKHYARETDCLCLGNSWDLDVKFQKVEME
jgi:hypothetical protein